MARNATELPPWTAERAILHVDMDAFFAAIAVLDDPSLKGLPVLTGGTSGRGVVTTASYEARKFGCHSAMPMSVALRLCPHARCVKVPGQRIRELSGKVFEILDGFTPLVQPLSVDEARVDLTGTDRLLGHPAAVARRLKETILRETGLVASVGLAPNPMLAKIASDLEKPDALVVFWPEDLPHRLDSLPIEKIPGIGPAQLARLHKHGIKTFGDARLAQPEILLRRLGAEEAVRLQRLAQGKDARRVTCDSRAKSIGQEQTFAQNIDQVDHLRGILLGQCEEVGRRIRRKQRQARALTVKIRTGDFHTVTRSQTLERSSDATADLFAVAGDLFDRWCQKSFRAVRLLGVSAALVDTEALADQLGLFIDPSRDRNRKLDRALDQIADRFPDSAVHRGTLTPRKSRGNLS